MSKIASIRFRDLLPIAWSSLRRNRLRSVLTIGAIGVGIAVMVYLISLGYGLEQLTLGSIENSNSLLSITVNTASADLLPLNQAAITKISKISGVDQVYPRLTLKGQVSLNSQNAPTTIVGVDPGYLNINSSSQLEVGNYYRPDDTQEIVVTTGFLKLFGLDPKKTPLVLFSMQLDTDAYPGTPLITNLAVTGVVNSDSEQVVYIPRAFIESLLGSNIPTYESVKVTVPTINDIQEAREGLIANGFKVTAAVDTVQDIQNVFLWIRAVLAGMGLIAIFVATIGMFNTLTISLLERTREIGIMKALGVRNRDINRLFLTEAMLMGILGGIAGISVAIIAQQLTIFALSILASVANGTVPVIFDNQYYLIGGAFIFAVLIAMVTGFYPARRATRLNPIDAIRHE